MAFLWDARHEPRTRLEMRIIVECDNRRYSSWAVDLNERGLGFLCPTTLYVGQKVTVAFDAGADGSQHVVLLGVVKHSSGFRHGCEFVNATARDRQSIRALTTRVKAEGRAARRAKPQSARSNPASPATMS